MYRCNSCGHRHLGLPDTAAFAHLNGSTGLDHFGGCHGCDRCAEISEDMADRVARETDAFFATVA